MHMQTSTRACTLQSASDQLIDTFGGFMRVFDLLELLPELVETSNELLGSQVIGRAVAILTHQINARTCTCASHATRPANIANKACRDKVTQRTTTEV